MTEKKSIRPFFSLIIPYHESRASIHRLLRSIDHSDNPPRVEVIVVDDGSSESSKFLPAQAGKVQSSKLINRIKLKSLYLTQNRGPAVARNCGAKIAKGKFLVFLDSDVELFPDTLKNLARIYEEDPDIVAVTGVWVKDQRSRDFFPNFKALRDWSYWINERDKNGYYYLFSTRIASIKRSVFLRLGGFNERYPAPLVEDIEFTYRIARRYAVIFAPNVRVHHEFEGFLPVAKKYFLRSYHWVRLYKARRKFDPVATTWSEALTAISGFSVLVFLLSIGLYVLFLAAGGERFQGFSACQQSVCRIGAMVYFLLACLSILHCYLVRRFLSFVFREKGAVFAFKSFFVGIILYTIIFSGAFFGKIAKSESQKSDS